MKKIVLVLLSLISVISIAFSFGGCRLPTIRLFSVGTYETYEVEGEPFIKAKFILRAISKEEFESADGVNVIKNESKDKENNIYYSFELFLYDDTVQDYEQVKILSTRFSKGTPCTYYFQTEYESNGKTVSGMTLNYHTIMYQDKADHETKYEPRPNIHYQEIYEDGQTNHISLRFKLTDR